MPLVQNVLVQKAFSAKCFQCKMLLVQIAYSAKWLLVRLFTGGDTIAI